MKKSYIQRKLYETLAENQETPGGLEAVTKFQERMVAKAPGVGLVTGSVAKTKPKRKLAQGRSTSDE